MILQSKVHTGGQKGVSKLLVEWSGREERGLRECGQEVWRGTIPVSLERVAMLIREESIWI